jgi:glucose-1-phosphate cytidylyltransferase
MKVVLFCGGLGMRLREYAGNVPKPMVLIGERPIIWYLMKYYAHYGHKDFILCLGYGATAIKQYFLNYEEYTTNDFILADGGRTRQLLTQDIHDWRITFVDTGLDSSIGERLVAVRRYLEGEEMFLANYADGLTDLHLPDQVAHFERSGSVASFLSVRPNLSYHFVEADGEDRVVGFHDIAESGIRVNGGFFIFREEVFDFIEPGEDLVFEPFQRMIAAGKLVAYPYDGYWQAVDTAKDKARVDELHASGKPPWHVWNNGVEARKR